MKCDYEKADGPNRKRAFRTRSRARSDSSYSTTTEAGDKKEVSEMEVSMAMLCTRVGARTAYTEVPTWADSPSRSTAEKETWYDDEDKRQNSVLGLDNDRPFEKLSRKRKKHTLPSRNLRNSHDVLRTALQLFYRASNILKTAQDARSPRDSRLYALWLALHSIADIEASLSLVPRDDAEHLRAREPLALVVSERSVEKVATLRSSVVHLRQALAVISPFVRESERIEGTFIRCLDEFTNLLFGLSIALLNKSGDERERKRALEEVLELIQEATVVLSTLSALLSEKEVHDELIEFYLLVGDFYLAASALPSSEPHSTSRSPNDHWMRTAWNRELLSTVNLSAWEFLDKYNISDILHHFQASTEVKLLTSIRSIGCALNASRSRVSAEGTEKRCLRKLAIAYEQLGRCLFQAGRATKAHEHFQQVGMHIVPSPPSVGSLCVFLSLA